MAGTGGFLDDLPVAQVREFEAELYKYVDSTNPALLRAIMEKKTLDDELKGKLQAVIKEAKQQFVDSRQEAEKAEPKKPAGQQRAGKTNDNSSDGAGNNAAQSSKNESAAAKETAPEKQPAIKH